MQRNARTSVMWSGIQQISIAGIQFLITIILARILSPSDYGLIAMLTVFFAFSQAFVDSGLSGALIQKKEITDSDYNAVLVFSIIVSVCLYLILFLCAPLIAMLFHNELLIPITKVYMLDLIINALCMVPFARLQRDLKFDVIAKITTTSSFLSGCLAVWMAYSGFAYWALVVQLLFSSGLNAICYWCVAGWRPDFRFSYTSLKSMMSFGVPVMLTSVVNSIYNNIYSLIIGGKYTAVDLGLYNRANSFASFVPTNFSSFSLRALFPVFSRYQDNLQEFKERILTTLNLSLFVVTPINVFIFFFSDDIIEVVLTEKWLPMSFFMKILSVSSLFYIATNLQYNALKSLGRTKELFKSELTKRIIGMLIVFITVWYGIKVMVLGLLFFSIIEFYIGSYYIKRNANITALEQILQGLKIFIISVLAGIIAFICSTMISNMIVKLLLSAFLYFAIYLSFSFIKKEKGLVFLLHLINRNKM